MSHPCSSAVPASSNRSSARWSRSGLDAARLEIEITEGVLLHETDETLATLRRLRGLGITIAMDDFGTGYSSLGYLQKFRFDKIKIDRSFVQNLAAIHTLQRSQLAMFLLAPDRRLARADQLPCSC